MAKPSLALGLQTCLGQHKTLLEDYSDFTVVVEGVEFPCHRLILASCSTFFRLLLGTNMKERSENKAILKNIKKETFAVIVNAVYKGEDGLNRSNIVDVWYASHILDISYLFQECEQFVQSVLDTENYIQLYHYAKMLNSESVTSNIYKFILENFEHFLSTQAFIYLSFEEIHEMIEDFNLNVSSEEVVIYVILKWINVEGKCEILEKTINSSRKYIAVDFNEAEMLCDNTGGLQNDRHQNNLECLTLEIREQLKQARKEKLSILLSSIRLCLVSVDSLTFLLHQPWIMSDLESVALVKKALMYHWHPEHFIDSLVKFRKCHAMFNAMVFLEGTNISLYSFEEKKEIISFEVFKNIIQMSSYREKLFISYKTMALENFVQYDLFDLVSRDSIPIAKLKDDSGSCFLFHQNFIFLFSAHETPKEQIQLLPINNYCFSVLKSQRTIHYACIHKHHIFAFSGDEEYTDIHMYGFDGIRCVFQKRIPGPSYSIVSFQHDGEIYILQRNGDLWVLEISVRNDTFDLRELTSLWSFEWCLRGAVCLSRELFLFGEYFQEFDNVPITTSSLPGVFDRIEVVVQSLTTHAVPLIVPRNIQQISALFN